MEGQGGLRSCQLRVGSQCSRSMPTASLCRVCCVSWGCVTIMACLCALVVALPSCLQEMPHGRCVTSSTVTRPGAHCVSRPLAHHGSARFLLKAEPFAWKGGSGRRHLLLRLLTEWPLPGAHSHHRGSLVYPSLSLSPEAILSPIRSSGLAANPQLPPEQGLWFCRCRGT